MKSMIYRILSIIALNFISSLGFSQPSEIKIEFLGNCGMYMTDGDINFYIDFPYKSGAHGYMEYDESELDSIEKNAIFIFTHKHSDHYSKKILRQIVKAKGGKQYGVSNISDLEKLSESLEDFKIEAFKTRHKVFGINFKHYSYLITWHKKRIYLSGDTTVPDTIGKVKDIDLAFIPYWLYQNANVQNVDISAKEIGIYHLYPDEIELVDKYFESKNNIHPLSKQGEIILLNILIN